jgi:hypothetical protein
LTWDCLQVNQQWPVVMLHSQQDLAADAAEEAAVAHQARPARMPRRRHTIVNQLRQHINSFTTPGAIRLHCTCTAQSADGVLLHQLLPGLQLHRSTLLTWL